MSDIVFIVHVLCIVMLLLISYVSFLTLKLTAKKRGMEVDESGELTMDDDTGIGDMERMMMTAGGISGMVVDEFDDEDDFY